MILALGVFLLSSFFMVYTYLLYPLIVQLITRGKNDRSLIYSRKDKLPKVCIIMSAFNEESIIEKKIHSVFKTDYPEDKLHFLIGSDKSEDNTDAILESLAKEYKGLEFLSFSKRRGKSNVLNDLYAKIPSDSELIIMTDANVIFKEDTVFEMAKYYKDASIGQVAANIINYGVSNEDIGAEEAFYIGRENIVKYGEGLLWGASMGAFGACYMIRKQLIPRIPQNYLMEDFFISLHVLKENYSSIVAKKAIVLEDLPGQMDMEYRRKRRISAGNYQNLNYYFKHFAVNFFPNGFVFFSHKVLRWLGPFLLLAMAISAGFLATKLAVFRYLCLAGGAVLIWVALDFFIKGPKFYFRPIRMIRYFIFMNMALLAGFWMFLKGVRTNAWTPTIRKS